MYWLSVLIHIDSPLVLYCNFWPDLSGMPSLSWRERVKTKKKHISYNKICVLHSYSSEWHQTHIWGILQSSYCTTTLSQCYSPFQQAGRKARPERGSRQLQSRGHGHQRRIQQEAREGESWPSWGHPSSPEVSGKAPRQGERAARSTLLGKDNF